ncbi:MAG TPA: hypothetical protein VGG85_05760 [Terracidiphilus sp.]|jgi:hypothetical protein
MEINLQALARGKATDELLRLSTGVVGKQYHGFLGSVEGIIESPAPPDKQSRIRKRELRQFELPLIEMIPGFRWECA